MKQRDPVAYNQVIDKPIFTTWFFGFENNKSVLISIHFYVNNGVKKPVVVSASTEEPPVDEIATFRWREPYPNGIIPGGHPASNSNIDRVKHFVTTFIKIAPRQAGGPIDVLIVTKAGRKWIQKNGDCN